MRGVLSPGAVGNTSLSVNMRYSQTTAHITGSSELLCRPLNAHFMSFKAELREIEQPSQHLLDRSSGE